MKITYLKYESVFFIIIISLLTIRILSNYSLLFSQPNLSQRLVQMVFLSTLDFSGEYYDFGGVIFVI